MPENGRQRSRFQSVLLCDYSTRILLGLLGSLGVLLLVLHLPFGAGFEPPTWYVRAPTVISISEVDRSEDADEDVFEEETSRKDDDSPPPTRQGPRVKESRTMAVNKGDTNPGNTGKEDDRNTKISDKEVVSITTLTGTDRKPQLVGGNHALYLHISYPHKARRQGIEGRLKLSFTVTSEGGIRHIDVEKSLHPLCDSAAVRGLRSVRFRPAKRQGEPVPVRMSLPIRFELEKQDTTSFRTSRRGSRR